MHLVAVEPSCPFKFCTLRLFPRRNNPSVATRPEPLPAATAGSRLTDGGKEIKTGGTFRSPANRLRRRGEEEFPAFGSAVGRRADGRAIFSSAVPSSPL